MFVIISWKLSVWPAEEEQEEFGVMEDECLVYRLLYQPPVALFMDINRLMTKYSSLCPKLSKYLDTQLPFVGMYNRERNRWDKKQK